MTRRPPALSTLGWAALALAAAGALWRPVIPFDAWWYHLPFAARIWGLLPLDAYVLDPVGEGRWLGYPKAWHVLMGAFWAAGGGLRATILPQLSLCAAFLWGIGRVLAVPVPVLAAGLLASPMLLTHSQAVYLDLPAGLCLGAGFVLLLDIAARGATPGRAVAAVLAVGLAGNIKYQGTIGAALVLAIAAALTLAAPGRRLPALAVIAAAGLLAGASLAGNALRLGQPLYPMEIAVAGRVLLPGPESPDTDARPPVYQLAGGGALALPGPANFLLSLSELDWTLRGTPPWYNLDANGGEFPRRGSPSRTGGLGAAFVLVHLGLLAMQLATWRRLDRRQRLLAAGATLLLLLTALLPRAHELRYWLVLPVVLVAVNLAWLARLGWPPLARAVLAGLLLYGAALTAASPRSELLARPPIDRESLRAAVPDSVRAALARDGRFCAPDDKMLFRFSAPVTGLPARLSLDDQCR